MDIIFGGLPAWAFWLACLVTVFAGFVKGAIGFAMPLIMISAFGSFMPPETALAALLLSVVTTNLHQSLRQGWRPALETTLVYWRFIVMVVIGIVISAPFVHILPQSLLLGLLGVPVTLFAAVQLLGSSLAIRMRNPRPWEYGLGMVGGLYGGISGVWGPPLLVYLLSVGTTKIEAVRVQGVVFLIGAVALLGAHTTSGLLNAQTLPLSAVLVIPAALGMAIGFRLQDRLDAVRFRRWTLILLCITGLNLVRRAVMG